MWAGVGRCGQVCVLPGHTKAAEAAVEVQAVVHMLMLSFHRSFRATYSRSELQSSLIKSGSPLVALNAVLSCFVRPGSQHAARC